MSGLEDAGEAARRWERAQAIFHAAAERAPQDREAFVHAACGDDGALAAQVLALLAADAGGHALLDGGLAAAAGGVMAGAAEPLPRQAFGPYRIAGVLGEGGMGMVYRGVRDDLGSEAAIKVLRDASLSRARRERFAFEQRVLANLDHPSIARLYDADTLPDGTPWFAMELVDGQTLTEYCRARALGVTGTLRLFREVCEAVRHAHASAILHRDLKPSNILVRPDGRVKLLDFGIAKPLDSLSDTGATRTGLRLMTPAYAAPEQVRGGPLGIQTDVYALGVVLYELLAGRLPFDLEGCTPSEAATVLTEQAPRRPSLVAAESGARRGLSRAAWADLDVLCLTAMHADVARRYASVDALVRDIDRFVAGDPLEARGDSLRYRAGKFARRHTRALVVAGAAVALLVGVVTFYTLRLAAERDRAEAESARRGRIQRFMTQLFQGGDEDAGPSDTLRVMTLLDQGVRQAHELSADPALQAELERTLGIIHMQLGRVEAADTLLTHALQHTERARPVDRADLVTSLDALAMLRDQQERWPDAERLARRALETARGELPAGAPGLAEALNTLGRIDNDRGNYTASLPLLDEAVALRSAPGVASSELADALTDLSIAYIQLGRLREADSLDHRLLEMSRTLFGPRHPNVADDLINIAAIARSQGRYADAERDDRAALGIVRGWFGASSPRTADVVTILSRDLLQLHRWPEADSLLRGSLGILTAAYGPEHTLVAGTLNELGSAAEYGHHFAQAESCYRAAVAIYRHRYGGKHANVGIAESNLGQLYMDHGDNARAEGCFREALVAYDGVVPEGSTDVGIARIKLGRSLLRQKKYAEAERETLAGYRTVARQAEPSISFLRGARSDLAAEYDALGRPADAAHFRAEQAALAKR